MENDLRETLLSRLMLTLMDTDTNNLPEIKRKISVILSDFKIEAKEEALVVWTEGKNDYFIKRFLLAKSVSGCTQRTVKTYREYLNRIFRTIGKDADTITPIEIQAFLAKTIQSTTLANADNNRRVLSSFYGWCQKEELIMKNPMNKVDRIKVRKQEKKAFTEIECEHLRDACRTTREKAIVEMLLSTGCRVSELANIKTADIDGKEIRILGKGEKYRNVYLNAKAIVALEKYIAERKDNNQYLFPRMADKCRSMGEMRKYKENWFTHADMVDDLRHMDNSTIENICRNLGKRAGIDNVHPHRFRRTCATTALRKGMPIEQVSKMLGHEELSTTQIYLDIGENELKNAHEKYVT